MPTDEKKAAFSARLIALREEAGLNQTDLGKHVAARLRAMGELGARDPDINPSTIVRWEKPEGGNWPDAAAVIALCEILRASADYLLGISTDRKPEVVRSGDWVVDLGVLDDVRAGKPDPGDEAGAFPVPPRFAIRSHSQYKAMKKAAQEEAAAAKKKPPLSRKRST